MISSCIFLQKQKTKIKLVLAAWRYQDKMNLQPWLDLIRCGISKTLLPTSHNYYSFLKPLSSIMRTKPSAVHQHLQTAALSERCIFLMFSELLFVVCDQAIYQGCVFTRCLLRCLVQCANLSRTYLIWQTLLYVYSINDTKVCEDLCVVAL